MIAVQCDRCGAFYGIYNTKNDENKINGINTLNINKERSYYQHGPYDLCPVCSKELYEWLTLYKNNNGEEK